MTTLPWSHARARRADGHCWVETPRERMSIVATDTEGADMRTLLLIALVVIIILFLLPRLRGGRRH